jgi:hypothetical protein
MVLYSYLLGKTGCTPSRNTIPEGEESILILRCNPEDGKMHGKYPALIDVSKRVYHLKNIFSIDGDCGISKDSEGRSVIIAEEERLVCRCLQSYLVKIPKHLVIKREGELVLQGYRIKTGECKEHKPPKIYFRSEMGKYYIGRISIPVKQKVQFSSEKDDSFLPIRCELYLNGFPSKIFAWVEFEARNRKTIDRWKSDEFQAICPVNVSSSLFEENTLMQSDRSSTIPSTKAAKGKKSKVKGCRKQTTRTRKKKSTGVCKDRKRALSQIEINCQNNLQAPDRRRMKKSPIPGTKPFWKESIQKEDLFRSKRIVGTKDGQNFTVFYDYDTSNAQETSDEVQNIMDNRQHYDEEILSSDIDQHCPTFKDCDYSRVFDENVPKSLRQNPTSSENFTQSLVPNPTYDIEDLSLNTSSNATTTLDEFVGNDDDTSANQEILCSFQPYVRNL